MRREVLILNLFSFIYISIFSFFIAYYALDYKPRNDLKIYGLYFECINSNFHFSCSDIIGSSGEIFFYLFSFLFSLVSPDYSFFLFYYSVFILSSVLFWVISLCKGNGFFCTITALFFLFTDFRYYDLSSNVLRHGLACSMMLMFIYFFIKQGGNKTVGFLSTLPLLSHLSSVGHFFLFLKSEILNSKFFWLFVFFVSYFFSEIFFNSFLNGSGDSYIYRKLIFYSQNASGESGGIVFPLHYALVVILSLVINVEDRNYLVVRKVLFVYVALILLFIPLGMSYRFVSFIMPLCAICFSFQINFITKKIHSSTVSIFLYTLVSLFFIVLFFKNYYFIMKAF
ncbi:EpsG family protein [Shewanella algae]|uniref:EpsG family protein n=1 Tax=Shewanella algae TaxID=38313 RepID=UPI00313AFA3B